ncbi:aminotransferase class V-fold PLP-dependent enzyme [Sphingopyxis panaciterrae]
MSAHRERFAVPGPGPYLLSHSVGCMPRALRERFAADMWGPWTEAGSDGWPDWLAAIDRFRATLARVVGGTAEEICPQPSVSAALTSLLSGLKREPGRDVLLASAHSFPSIGFALTQIERWGYRLELIPEDADPSQPESWLDRIGPHVAAVVPMHVHSNSGLIAPVAAIAEAARANGSLTILDICQSTGIVPIDLQAFGVDAAIGSCVKWLCGGPGAGFVWVRRDLIAEIEPVDVGWFSHVNPFEFDIRDFRYAGDALRFWGGTPSIAPYVQAIVGVEECSDIGAAARLAHNRDFIAVLADAAEAPIDMTGRGGTMCLQAPDIEALAQALAEIGCRFDRRAAVIRLSPHIYNGLEEARALGGVLRGTGFSLA